MPVFPRMIRPSILNPTPSKQPELGASSRTGSADRFAYARSLIACSISCGLETWGRSRSTTVWRAPYKILSTSWIRWRNAARASDRSLKTFTTTPAGRLIFHVFASIAQFERERIAERTREGLQAARTRGRVGGRPPALTTAQKAEARRMRDEEVRSIAEIAQLFKVSQQTVRRV